MNSKPFEILESSYNAYLSKPILKYAMRNQAISAAQTDIQPLYRTQKMLRPLWGKAGINDAAIGDHPHFVHLKGTDQKEYHPIVTMFLDIENSTRLGVLYPLDEVHRIKNAIICCAIEIIHSLDGHVHRIMGDAVMAFFGGKNTRTEDAIIDGLNCASTINAFFQSVVLPRIGSRDDDSVGIRIGMDYGCKEKVLWSSYGYPGVDEVTATGFHVDVASKLQRAAGKNNIMIGQALRDHIDFPQELLDTRKVQKDGKDKDEIYLRPNFTDANGNPINYRQFVLQWREYLLRTNIGQLDHNALLYNRVPSLPVSAELFDKKDGEKIRAYQPASRVTPKGGWLRFKATLPNMPKLPATIRFVVENHGGSAAQKPNNDNHESSYPIEFSRKDYYSWESLAYRGFHYMTVKVDSPGNRIHFSTSFGVYVE